MSPKTLGRFEIIHLLGRGAMGCVYLAHDPRIDRRVAIKTLEGLAALPEQDRIMTRVRFLREAQAAGRLSHPNIVTIFDVGEEGDTPYIAMEFLDGVSLANHTSTASLLPVGDVLAIMDQACDALHYAHSAGFVHRDIKPANMMLVSGRVLKIADFGLAKRPESSMTTDGLLVGTPYYMSPEQIRGAALDGRSDLFSLGVVLYQLFNGLLPFPGESIHTVIHRIMTDPPVEFGVDIPLPGPLRAFVRRALEKDPDLRPASGDEFRRELREAFEGSGIRPSSPLASRGETRADPRTVRVAARAPGGALGSAPVLPIRSSAEPARTGAASRAGTASSRAEIAVEPSVGTSVESRDTRPSEYGAAEPRSAGQRGARPARPGETAAIGRTAAAKRRGRAVLGAATVGGAVLVAAGAIYYVLFLARGSGDRAPSEPQAAAPRPPAELADAGPTIRVITEPSASLFLDGKALSGPTFRLLSRDTGTHTIRAESGCKSAEREVIAGSAPAEVRLELAPEKVTMPVVSAPPGARVTLNGKSVPGKTPVTIEIDRCAENRVELALEGYKPVEYRLAAGSAVAPLQAALGSVAFKNQEPGRVRTAKGPYKGSIFADGRLLGDAGGSFTLAAGKHRLALVNDALFVRLEEQVAVPAGGEIDWKPSWPAVGSLTVQATPTNCSIEVRPRRDSSFRYIDDVPILRYSIAAGSYTVRAILRSTGESREREVEVLPGAKASIDFTF